MSAARISGGTLTLGGSNNGNGRLIVKNSSGSEIATLDNDGLAITNSGITIGNFYNPVDAETYNGIRSTQGKYKVYLFGRTLGFEYNNHLCKMMYLNGNGNIMFTSIAYDSTADLYIKGDVMTVRDSDVYMWQGLTVAGTKSRVVTTDQYSDRLLYCYETPTPMFGDIGEGIISDYSYCYVSFDAIFAQTINSEQYQVFLQPYGEGSCQVIERRGSYFVVKGTPGLGFGWEIKAKQRDYDQLRLERTEETFNVPGQTYATDAAEHIQEIRKERGEI